MDIRESFMTALEGITAHKLRSALTMLGIIIGVAAVIALMSIGNGVSSSVSSRITSIGTNLITISADFRNRGSYPPLSMSDFNALSKPLNAPALSAVAASVEGNQTVVNGSQSVQTSVTGVTPNYFTLRNMTTFQSGDRLTQEDLDARARVAVLGATTATDLFGTENPYGKSVKINGVSYDVVGVLQTQGQGFGGNPDATIYIPLTTAQVRLFPNRTRTGEFAVSSITAQAASADVADAATTQVTALLRERHKLTGTDENDFRVFSQTSLLSTLSQVTGTLTAFLGAIAGISLLVGGIGIMNILLVSVTERTREIGIRKAIGALKRDILFQFLLEAVLLSLMGGLIGILLGWGISTVASSLLNVTTVVAPKNVLMAAGFAAAVGLIFGMYPAWRAAGMRPIDALRYE